MTSLLLVTPDLGDNSTGRAHVWWMLASRLGWNVQIVSPAGEQVWGPLRGTEFAEACARLTSRSRLRQADELAKLARHHDAVVAVKPLPASLGIALAARARTDFPLIVDIDDPDLEARMSRRNPLTAVMWRARHPAFWLRVRRFDAVAATAAVTTSNPILQARYGGTLLPHARPDHGGGRAHTRREIVVAFIGTVRLHKGIAVLREAVARLSGDGVRLVVTADAPPDAEEWELWAGEGTMDEGARLLAEADVVALPSLPSSFAEGQLPAKLIDAMIAERAVVVSAIDPMPWAVGIPELCVPAGSAAALAEALRSLVDPHVRAGHARALRKRALDKFSVDALAPLLDSILLEAKGKAEDTGADVVR